MTGGSPAPRVACLMLSAGDVCWLAPASMVAEVIAHFDDAAPGLVEWCGRPLPCLDRTAGRVRALAVLRRVSDRAGGFYAVALSEPPRAVWIGADELAGAAGESFELDGRPVRVLEPAALEAQLPRR